MNVSDPAPGTFTKYRRGSPATSTIQFWFINPPTSAA
jgi:hypothetical protein